MRVARTDEADQVELPRTRDTAVAQAVLPQVLGVLALDRAVVDLPARVLP